MSIGADLLKPTRLPRRSYRLRRTVTEAASVLLGIALLIWSLLPVYNMLLIALDPEEGERAVAPLRRFGSPLVDLIRPRSYLKMITYANLGAPAGRSYYEKASTLSDLSDEAIDVMVAYGLACSSPLSQILIQHVHGAATRVGPTETAFALRGESYVICMVAAWDDGEAHRHIAWTRACWRAIEPFANSGSISTSWVTRAKSESEPPMESTTNGWWPSRTGMIRPTSSRLIRISNRQSRRKNHVSDR